MKSHYFFLFVLTAFFCSTNGFAQKSVYSFNRAPLQQGAYVQLPLGSIKAKGWLLKQLELQKAGATGNAEALYPEAENLGPSSDWLGGNGNSWEKVPYYVKGLVALAYTLDDASLKAKAKKWIDYTLAHQQENGSFGPPKMKDWWPRMPFMYALQSYYEATSDKRVVPFLTKYFRYQLANIDKIPLDSWGKSRAGDNIEIALWVYNKTGDTNLLQLVSKLKEQAYPWIDIFNDNKFMYYGDDFQPKHMVNVAQALKFPAIYAQIDTSAAPAMQNGINHIMHDNRQPSGLGSGTEFMSGNSSIQGVETCTVVEWMQSLETASRIIHNSSIGDQLEQIAFNALPAQFSRDLKGHSYYSMPNQVISAHGPHGFNQDYNTGFISSPYSGFPCCRYNMHMGWPYFVKNSCMATSDGGLALNTYGPMEVTAIVAKNSKIKLIENTNYPFQEQIRLTIQLARPVSFPLQFRIPGWCLKPEVFVNGKKMDGVKSAELFKVNRKWSNNDQVVLNFPMHLETHPEVNNGISISRGPIVYALKIKQAQTNTKEFAVKGFYETEYRAASPWNYGLVLGNTALVNQITLLQSKMPDNPFIAAQTPLQLKINAKQIPAWTVDYNQTAAFDVPFSPLPSAEKTEEITLVPYGSQNLRVSIFPTIGKVAPPKKGFLETFEHNTANGWVIYGGGWFYKDNSLHCASNGDNSSGTGGSKIIATCTNYTDLIYSAAITVNAAGDAGLLFRVAKPAIGANAYCGYYIGLNPEDNTVVFGKASDNKWIVIATAKQTLDLNKTYLVKVKAVQDKFEIYINDATQPLIRANDSEFKSGQIGLRTYKALAIFDDINVSEMRYEVL